MNSSRCRMSCLPTAVCSPSRTAYAQELIVLRLPDLATVCLFSWPAGDGLAHYVAAISACHVHAVRLARLLQIVIKNEVGNLSFEIHLCTQAQVATLYTPPIYCAGNGFDVPNTSMQAHIHKSKTSNAMLMHDVFILLC